jgi:hypothetical protein
MVEAQCRAMRAGEAHPGDAGCYFIKLPAANPTDMLALIAILLFPYLLWKAWKNIGLARESAAWPSLPGKVTSSERVKRMVWTQPRVTFSYQVDGKEYTGSNIAVGGGVNPKETDAILGRYPTGSAVTVHYCPKDASMAVLEPGPNRYVVAVFRTYLVWFILLVGSQAALIALNRNEAADTDAPTYGDGTPGDNPAATYDADHLIQVGADNGDAKDEGIVAGWRLRGERGYTKDPEKAAEDFQRSADQGEASSQAALGLLYAQGNGVPKDFAKAVEWFQKAANQGDPLGCLGMGMAYEKGVAGIPQDKQKAIEWYKKAGDIPAAKQALARLGAN